MNIRRIDQRRAAKFRRIVDDEPFDIDSWFEQPELNLANLRIIPGAPADLLFRERAGDGVLQQQQANHQDDGEEQKAKGPSKDESDHNFTWLTAALLQA